MAESLVLTTPEQPPAVTSWKITSIEFYVETQRITCSVVSDSGERRSRTETGPTAVSLMSTLNTANGTIKSLQRRVLEYLQSKGDLAAGAVTGAPD
jgi:hypothetical protein